MNRATFPLLDIIVIGGGHAGCEAFAAASRIGARVALVTPDVSQVGYQPCNPAVGGPGKGHLVREVVALGGLMGRVTDLSGLQFRTLNRRKGPAVRSTRVQTDSKIYVTRMAQELARIDGKSMVIEDEAIGITWSREGGKRRVTGVQLSKMGEVRARAVVVATGTFLRGMLFTGNQEIRGGRMGAGSAVDLAESLEKTGLPMFRLKTGTCPRLAGDSIDVSRLEEQFGDDPPPFFDPDTTGVSLPQRTCFLTYTGEPSHEVIRKNMASSALYGGSITGIGPRYCPSIETKIARFPDKDRHQVFLEPQDAKGEEIYPSGLSTSLPQDVQEEMIHAIVGLEKARIVRWGYAVEYDSFQPTCLTPSLEVDGFGGLFLAGQILGTSGYEEAASLGLAAGANAALSILGDRPLDLTRDQSYMGVMIDDLTVRGVDEPYRMFTSRAEYRLLLREDNADERMVDEGERTGLINAQVAREVRSRSREVGEIGERLEKTVLTPSRVSNAALDDLGLARIKKPTSLYDLMRRDGVRITDLAHFAPWIMDQSAASLARVEVEVKYSGYLGRQRASAERLSDVDSVRLPPDMDYHVIPGLRGEAVEKLSAARPSTLGQVSRIPGITSATIEILRVFCQKAARKGS